jgi:hypothetical protein
MLALKSASPWGWPNHPGLIGGLGCERHAASMQDASARSQRGLEEQSAPHFAQAMCSVIPPCGALPGTDAFSGAEDSARGTVCQAD